jgi:UDP-N-acetylmuramoyl-tripeptide--D-alanyl-D-alanine ligase
VHRFAVIECGMSVRGEIARLGSLLSPDVAVITNVSVAHAEGVGGSREDVAREKGALFESAQASGTCVFDADDPLCESLAARSRAAHKVSFGQTAKAQYRMTSRVPLGASGSRVTIERPIVASPRIEADLPLVGEAAAIDLCAALAAADAVAGPLSQETVARAMARAQNVDGRATVHSLADNVLVIDDSYNANPISMRAAFSTLADLAGGRRSVAVLGEMKELGDRARVEHAALGDALAAMHVSLVIGCGGLVTDTLQRAKALGIDTVDCASVDEATSAILARIRAGDVVLVKGSRSVGAERIVVALKARA